jgi:cytoskeletal protein RodZ
MKEAGGEHGIKPERRMKGLLWLVLLEPIGLFAFAWTSLGPPEVYWIAPLIFVALIGIANLAIYQATCDYMVSPVHLPSLNPSQTSKTNTHHRSPPTASTPPLPPGVTASAATPWPASPRCTPPPSTPTSSTAPSGSSPSPASSSPASPSRSSSRPTSSTSTAPGSATAPRTPASLLRSVLRTWVRPRRWSSLLRKRTGRMER